MRWAVALTDTVLPACAGFGFTPEALVQHGIPSEAQLIASYLRHLDHHLSSTRTPGTFKPAAEWLHVSDAGVPQNWHYFTSFALFRVAAILQVRCAASRL